MTTSRSWDDIQTRLDARRVPPDKPALTFAGIPLEYWRREKLLSCAASLKRLQAICQERGADYEKTIVALKGE
jgi:hypothetical protein